MVLKFICDDGNRKSVIKSIFELMIIIAEKFDFIIIACTNAIGFNFFEVPDKFPTVLKKSSL